jgi:hypothetical protein
LRRKPERLRFRGADVEAEHFAPTIAVDADRNDHGNADDAPVLAHPDVGGVDPQIWPVALDRAAQKRLHLLVDLRAQPAHLALGDAAHPHRLDQVVHRARRHTVHIGFLNDGSEGLLGHAPGLEEARKVGSFAQLRDPQLDGSYGRKLVTA